MELYFFVFMSTHDFDFSHASARDVANHRAVVSCDRLGHPRARRRLHRHRFGFGAPNDGGVAARRGARVCVWYDSRCVRVSRDDDDRGAAWTTRTRMRMRMRMTNDDA